MSKREILGILIIALTGEIQAELVRVTPDPAVRPNYFVGWPIDLDADGNVDFSFAFEQVISLDYPTSVAVTSINVHPAAETFIIGSGYTVFPVGAGEVIGPILESEGEWITSDYRLVLASRSHNYRSGQSSAWSGVLADPAKPFIGIRFRSVLGVHYGWVRFGGLVDSSFGPFDVGLVVEWAYESEPDTPVIVSLPPVPNDSFNNATEFLGTHFKIWTDNSDATSEPGEPQLEPAGAGASLWWKWIAPANGNLRIAADAGLFDVVFGIFTGDSLDTLSRVGSSHIGCVSGSEMLVSQSQIPVVQGQTYHILLDSGDFGAAPGLKGEVRLEGTFSNLELGYPQSSASYGASPGVWMTAILSEWDGLDGSLSFEANGIVVAAAVTGDTNGYWYAPEPGHYEIQAVWQTTDQIVRRSTPRTIDVRPMNDDFFYSPFIDSNSFSGRASNRNASREEGELAPPSGAHGNSVWWRWTAPEDGTITVDVPDGNGDMSISICSGSGPWVSDVEEIASSRPDPVLPGKKLNHVQLSVGRGITYAFAVRSVKNTAGSWLPTGPCDEPVIPGRDFTLRMDFIPGEVGQLLVKRYGDELMASFAAHPGRDFVVESSFDLDGWEERAGGVATGVTQLLSLQIDPDTPTQFFRLKLKPDAALP